MSPNIALDDASGCRVRAITDAYLQLSVALDYN